MSKLSYVSGSKMDLESNLTTTTSYHCFPDLTNFNPLDVSIDTLKAHYNQRIHMTLSYKEKNINFMQDL